MRPQTLCVHVPLNHVHTAGGSKSASLQLRSRRQACNQPTHASASPRTDPHVGCRYRGEKLPEELLNGYRLPQLMQGWESGLLRFLTCRISGMGRCQSHLECFLMLLASLLHGQCPALGHRRLGLTLCCAPSAASQQSSCSIAVAGFMHPFASSELLLASGVQARSSPELACSVPSPPGITSGLA